MLYFLHGRKYRSVLSSIVPYCPRPGRPGPARASGLLNGPHRIAHGDPRAPGFVRSSGLLGLGRSQPGSPPAPSIARSLSRRGASARTRPGCSAARPTPRKLGVGWGAGLFRLLVSEGCRAWAVPRPPTRRSQEVRCRCWTGNGGASEQPGNLGPASDETDSRLNVKAARQRTRKGASTRYTREALCQRRN